MKAKINMETAREIRKLCEGREELRAELSKITNAELGRRYGLHKETIREIAQGLLWKEGR